jgi:rhamnulokinase
MPAIYRDTACIALDLGAESGRAILGQLQSNHLSIKEIARFRNEPVFCDGGLHWDVPRLWQEIQSALHALDPHNIHQLDGVGVDTWGVDYALLGKNGILLENPYHYRDARTNGVMERVLQLLTPKEIYQTTGIQFLAFNTIYQLYTTRLQRPELLNAAEHMLTIPDLFNFWMTGKIVCEYTNASTTQFLDVHTRNWALPILQKLGIPTRILPKIIDPGTVVGNILPALAENNPVLANTRVVAPACHDTGSAFAAVESGQGTALISSGTWSLLGAGIPQPVVTEKARRLNFTNEGGVGGTVRLLKNITGLWLLERCRREWQNERLFPGFEILLAQAANQRSLQHFVVPDDPSFVLPQNMPEAIVAFCAKTGQSKPTSPAAITRCILESLAMRYRQVLEWLEDLSGFVFQEIRIVGGGSQNDLLNQFTADATGRRVLAGPVEATALGNLALQLIGIGAVPTLSEARAIIAKCFPARVFEPRHTDEWEKSYRKFCALTPDLN